MKHLFRFSFILISLLFLACGDAEEESPLNPNPGDNNEDGPVLISPYVMEASKSYKPSKWTNQNVGFPTEIAFILPEKAEVINGRPGNHWATLSVGEEVICLYKGNGQVSKTDPPCGDNGDAYELSYCVEEEAYENEGCSSSPFQQKCKDLALDWIPEDEIVTSYLGFTVNNGDSCATTEVEIEL